MSETSSIREAMRAAQSYLAAHPDEARYVDSAAVASPAGGLRVSVTGPDGARLVTDMPASVGGGASAPSAGWVLRAAHAACVATLIVMRAAEREIPLSRLSVTAESDSDDRGILGVADTIPAGPLETRVRVGIASEAAGPEELAEIVDWAAGHCPVHDAVLRAVPVRVTIEREPPPGGTG